MINFTDCICPGALGSLGQFPLLRLVASTTIDDEDHFVSRQNNIVLQQYNMSTATLCGTDAAVAQRKAGGLKNEEA
jgi:hypothetical protein